MKKLNLLLLLTFSIVSFSCSGQFKNQGTVYAGVKAKPGSGAINREDVGIFLRGDLTFTDKLNAPNWKTAVTGKYTKEDGIVTLNYIKGKKTVVYKITKKGYLSKNGLILTKFDELNIPTGGFEYKNVTGSGGVGTSQDYVGSSVTTYIYFNADGTFTNRKSSATTVIGSNVGGGVSKKQNSAGTYKFNHGELTFYYNDGKTKKHSCFVSKPVGKDNAMILLDGKFYFLKK